MSWAASFSRLARPLSRVRHLRLVVLADLLELLAAGVGVRRRLLDEVEQPGLLAPVLAGPLDDVLLPGLVGAMLELEVVERRDRRHAGRRAVQRQRRRLVAAGEVERAATFIAFSALPTQPSVSVSAVLAACQMSIERKCDWVGFG